MLKRINLHRQGALLKRVVQSSIFGIIACFTLVVGVSATKIAAPFDDAIERFRFERIQREPSGRLVVVEIDNESLRQAQSWPWSRSRFVTAIQNLRAAGATIIGFDVDFSATSNPADDAAFAKVIAAQPGDVVLPVFLQRRSAAHADIVENRPIDQLSRDALLASVNVELSENGAVRRYIVGSDVAGVTRPSMAAILSGVPASNQTFAIDYGIRAQSIPRLSFADIYSGTFDKSLVRGKAVLIGGTAVELGDRFPTPVAASLPGVYVHALAFESIALGRTLINVEGPIALALAFVVILVLWPKSEDSDSKRTIRRHAVAAVGIFVGAFLIQCAAPISINVAPSVVAQLLCAIQAIRLELRRRAKEIVRQREENLVKLSLHDVETELPNRRAMLADIGDKLQGHEASVVLVAAIGIDRYAMLRGAIGYSSGNELIRNFAARLSGSHQGGMVAHLSTSILGLSLAAPDRTAAFEAFQRAIADMDTRVYVAGHKVDALFKIGLAFEGEGGTTPEALLESASLALDQARDQNIRLVTYQPSGKDPRENLSLVSDMVQGVKLGQFSLHYQPKIDLATGQVTSAEGLIRWHHPVRGRVAPDSFIPTAEETGTIRTLTEWAVHCAIFDQIEMRASGVNVCLSINISARMLSDKEFCQLAIEAIQDAGADLCFEITETAVIDDPIAAMAAVQEFRDAGIKISIDDYGSGFSSLSYLKQIAADELKIDRSLIVDIARSTRDQMILRSTIDLAHSLGLHVVVEGVEDHLALHVLRSMRCDSVQGYVYSPALEVEAFCDYVRSAQSDTVPELCEQPSLRVQNA